MCRPLRRREMMHVSRAPRIEAKFREIVFKFSDQTPENLIQIRNIAGFGEVWLVEDSPKVRRQRIVDGGGRNRRVARGDGELMQVRHDVSSGKEVLDRGQLAVIDDQGAFLGAAGAELDRKLRAHGCAES